MRRSLFFLAVLLVGSLVVPGLVLGTAPAQQAVTKVRGQEAGNAGDGNAFTFTFAKDNSPIALKKLDGTPIQLEAVERLYGSEDGMRVSVNGEDVFTKYNLRPLGVKLANEDGSWPEPKVAPDALPIDPETGRFILRIPQLKDLRDQGGLAKPLPSAGTGIDVAGNYVYITDEQTGLHIIDLSTRQEVGSYSINGETSSVTVAGQYAYVSEGGTTPALHIVDISNSKQPFLIPEGRVSFTSGTPFRSMVRGDYVYLTLLEGGLQIIKVHDDNDPQLIKPHPVFSYPLPQGGQVYGLTIVNNYAYITDSTKGFHVLDISDPKQPKLVKSVEDIGPTYDIIVRGKYAYLNNANGLRIVDLDTFRPLGSMRTSNPQELALIGNFVFITDWKLGLIPVDVSDPNKPKAVQLPNNLTGVVPAGKNAFAIRVVDDYIYVSNYAPSGLRVFQSTFNFDPVVGRVQVDYNY